jgi:hypothetical protein
MAIVVAIALGIVSLAFVLYPLYRRRPTEVQEQAVQAGTGEATTILNEREQSARTALQEVELDYQLGNISETDYGSLRERYMRRALAALKSRYDREQEIDAEIEEQLRSMKERGKDAAQ